MWDFHAAKMVALLDELGIERADFVCNSWGGTIALNLAAKYPERVRSLVITGSMPVFYGPLAPLPEDGRRGRNARDVHEIFFQVFDKGVMEDGEGRVIDFKNTLILPTTNAVCGPLTMGR